ncbi:ABC transporter permease [Bosea robiniae]|uniref:Capsular polysaccharide transport system permease protein n=1 Tax=Bosea robiniae TaxID=1036780 RepID=A0ABY0P594_9HYPH|nr:ABC transporter permease [Bosea robiniae]SDG72863.1 capsular polysaccharide transport system permease protein [Bosea robiniae]
MQPPPPETSGRSSRSPVSVEPRLVTRLSIQFQVIAALIVRNVMARYGRGNLGFLWLVVEPIFLVSGVMAVWTLLHRSGHGVPIAAFVFSSYIPLTLWRHLSTAPRVLSGNFGLLYHRRITVFDIMVARALTDIAGVSSAGLVVYFLLLSVGALDWIADPSLVLTGWLLMCLFGFGVGCVTASLSEKSEVIENLIQPIQYLLLPISGIFFMVSWIPKKYQEYLLWVPMIHIYEIIRAGIFGKKISTHYDINYILLWSVFVIFIGIMGINSSRKKLKTR